MKKILHIITGLNDGGAEGVLSRMCLLEPDKHQVISLMDMGKYGNILKKAGIPVYCMNMNPSKISLQKVINLYKTIRKINPEIVQTWMYHADMIGGVVAKIARVPNIFWGIRHSNLSKGTIKKSTYLIMRICAFLSFFLPKKIISCSRDAIFSHSEQGYCNTKFELIQNGYDLEKFKPFPIQENSLNFSIFDRPIIAMVARYDIQKDHKNLIRALAILKEKKVEVHTVLVGTGMVAENYELVELIKSNGLDIGEDITLFGRCSDIPSLMNAINIHVLSSLGEAFPNVLAEAMACGTPCISTDVGDAKEIIDQHGWVIPPENSEELAEAILLALNEFLFEPEHWAVRKQRCVEHIKNNFEIHSMVTKFHNIWGV
ncbi:glycosyltransferase [Acinetobacter baumannii]|nr:glycosyltransferase [Acinetobacter baumannii]